jgi:F-type H+-transporting ATPase subunit delta
MEELAKVYARSLFAVAKEHGILDEIRDQLAEFADALAESHDLHVFFFSPYFTAREKKDGIQRVVDGGDERFVRFLELLAEKHRMPVIFRIRRIYEEMLAVENRLLEASVTSAVELDEKLVKQIGERIEQETGKRVELTSRVDPDVLGGLVIRVGNTIMDATVRSRLERLRKTVARAA